MVGHTFLKGAMHEFIGSEGAMKHTIMYVVLFDLINLYMVLFDISTFG